MAALVWHKVKPFEPDLVWMQLSASFIQQTKKTKKSDVPSVLLFCFIHEGVQLKIHLRNIQYVCFGSIDGDSYFRNSQ